MNRTILALAFLSLTVGMAYAETEWKPSPIHHHIGVSISGTCMKLLSINDMKCPSYSELITVFGDSSHKGWSGNFTEINGIYQRERPLNEYHWKYYNFQNINNTVWIDPPIDIRHKIKMINIETHLPDFTINGSNNMINDTLTFGHSRWVDDDCRKATIKADGWLLMVGDTMQFLKHDCDPEYTAFKTTRTIQYEKTIIDITTTYWYQLQQYMAAAIEKYGWK